MNIQMPGSIKKVCVLLSSYNGEKYIEEQISSILKQRGVDVYLALRDDGSTDHTVTVAKKVAGDKLIFLREGNNIGVAESFWSLLDEVNGFDFYAFSDQDDIWAEDKLVAAVNAYTAETDIPWLYYCSNLAVDKHGRPILQSHRNIKGCTEFGRAIIASDAQGSTFVFNEKLKQKSGEFMPDFKGVGILHDAWMHKMCLALGGKVCYDPVPHLYYRIHGENVVARIPSEKESGLIGRCRSFLKYERPNYIRRVAGELIRGYGYEIKKDYYELLTLLSDYDKNASHKLRLFFTDKLLFSNIRSRVKFYIGLIANKA